MAKIVINEAACKGCNLCIYACKQGVLSPADHLNTKAYRPAAVTSEGKCKGCGFCALMCPDIAVTVYR